MQEKRLIEPFAAAVDATVELVGSKSYTNRAFILAALAQGQSQLRGVLDSDDTRYMAEALRELGVEVEVSFDDQRARVVGVAGHLPAGSARVFVGNSGTTARFLPVVMALADGGAFELDGTARMRERPIAPLIDALRALGGRVECLERDGCVPLRVHGTRLRGGVVRVPGQLSSQYITGLLMGGPYMADGLTLEVEGKLVSRPYIDMTIQAMQAFGAHVERQGEARFVVPASAYVACDYRIEPDASAASYFFAAAAITGGRVRVQGLGKSSLQGDLHFVRLLERMGCTVQQGADFTEVRGPRVGALSGIEVDMADLSDVAQTLAVVAAFASSPTRVTGIGFIRGKETDRVGAVVRELVRLGVDAAEESDGFVVRPGNVHGGEVHTYDDHRMAMSFALIGLCVAGVEILDPGCTSKTFPGYFDQLERLRR